jgi:D-alanyl-D-alanine carboxypeptidase
MKHTFYIFLASILVLCGCKRMALDSETNSCFSTEVINASHSKAIKIQQILNEIVQEGIPGVAIAIHTNEGYWSGASGLAKIETKEPMQICHLQYGQSVAKTYMATAILLMYDEGKIDLDEKITKYLSENITSKIKDAEKITVRMLLNHTSGVPEYNDNPQYVSYLLQHPLHEFTSMDYLGYVNGKPLLFTPGSKYKYSNTNYLLVALLADAVSGNHSAYIQDKILSPLGLNNTCYHNSACFNKPELVNSYWDRYSNRQIENCSQMQRVNVASLIGDDGIIATPIDYIRFLKYLFEGQIISLSAMNEMLTFVEKKPNEPEGYGLGLHKEFYKGYIDYGHTGGGIGASCLLSYYPEKDVFIFLGINIGTSIYSPNFDNLENKINAILDILLE